MIARWKFLSASTQIPNKTPVFGDLVPDPHGVLDLPPGFQYVVLESSGDKMSDGMIAGDRPDGMGCFWYDDSHSAYVLMRNHETGSIPRMHKPDGFKGVSKPVRPALTSTFDPNSPGGVSRIVIDAATVKRISSNLVLAGTEWNCGGGTSPWGWLSCEETRRKTNYDHGWVFLCDKNADQVVPCRPEPKRSLGCFLHEAAAVDPVTNIVYLTEDEEDGALYRHVPNNSLDPNSDPLVGKLQAMRVVDLTKGNLCQWLSGTEPIDWVEIEDPEVRHKKSKSTREQARVKDAAIVRNGEGVWFSCGAIFFVSTYGGSARSGQVFRINPTETGGTLTLYAQAVNTDGMLQPDSITMSPWGDLILGEDRDDLATKNCLWGLGADGIPYLLARNGPKGMSEFCGPCFSPDGKVLFVNLQQVRLTIAITGPFPPGDETSRFGQG